MFSWSQKRQIIYFSIPFFLFLLVLSFVYFSFFYKPATCFDGVKNGNETGIDCGGSCSLICTNDALKPITLWSKAFAVTDDVYNLVAFVQNPNSKSELVNASYVFSAYDANSLLIGKREGQISIPKNKKIAVFESGFKSEKPIKRVDFDFIDPLVWKKNEKPDIDFVIDNNPLENEKKAPKIYGNILSKKEDASNVELVVLVYDAKGNAVASSKTIVDNLKKGVRNQFVFTWPRPFNLGEEACEIPTATILTIDRSGSMQSISKEPPEPLTSVKNVANNFISRLTPSDLVGVVSFANTASSPADQSMTFSLSEAKTAVLKISIASSTPQNTNIADGLFSSFSVLYAKEGIEKFRKTIILLTDGKPTLPTDPSDKNYPYEYAKSIASDIKSAGVGIYTIGLGSEVDGEFLKQIATDEKKYFFAPNVSSLEDIYKQISASICKRKPNVIEIIANTR